MFEISRISSNPDGFLVRYHGPGKLSEFRLALRRIAELTTPGGPTMILSIVEKDAAMAIDETEFDSVGARRLAVEMSSLLAAIGPGRSASVLSEDFAFAVARMYGTYLEGASDREFAAFRSLAGAREWLGLNAPG